jgi:predicted DNA-binding protein (UPF0251 family)
MVRPIKPRRLLIPQNPVSFIPEGNLQTGKDEVRLLSEEFEVIKLVDYDDMSHLQASKAMNISRPTLTRIYRRARKKIAESLVELKSLKLGGGNSYLGENWFKCNDCEALFNIPGNNNFNTNCPVCLSKSIHNINNESNS